MPSQGFYIIYELFCCWRVYNNMRHDTFSFVGCTHIHHVHCRQKKLSTYHIIVLVLLINHRVSYCHLQVLGKSCLGKIYQPNSRCFVKTIKYIHLDFGTVTNGMKLHKTNIILSSALSAIENRETELSWTCIGTFGVFGCYSFYE